MDNLSISNRTDPIVIIQVISTGMEHDTSIQQPPSERVIASGDSHQEASTSRSNDVPQNHAMSSLEHSLPSPSEARKLTRKCPRCSWPISITAIFVGLGKFVTGYHLIVVLPNLSRYWASKDSDNNSDGPNIPFENLEEEIPTHRENNLETGNSIRIPDTTTTSSPELRVIFKLPVFIVLISISQWLFFHFVMNDKYDGWWSSNMEFNPLKRYEIWRFFTATWIHGTLAHLIGNLRLQLITGCCLEMIHGWRRVCALYFGGIIFANLTTSVAEPFLRAYGASGGVYALLTGHLASNIMNWKETWGSSNRCLLILIYLGLSIVAAFNNVVGQNVLPTHHLVGHAAHFGGALGGFLLGFCLLTNFHKMHWEVKIAKICRNTVIILFILAVGANIGDQIFYWKSIQYEYRKKHLLQLLQNHTTLNNTVHNDSSLAYSN